jgi:hypothetical protein
MIKITSYFPFQNLLKVTKEFHEDKAIVKTKSLTFESEFEFEYKDVVEVIDAFKSEYSQVEFGFWLLAISSFLSAVFRAFVYAHPPLLRIEQTLYIFGLLTFITAFKRTWRVYLLDVSGNTLVAIKQTRQNRDLVPQIIEKIRGKTEHLKGYTTANPFPADEFLFEHVVYDLPNLSKTTDRFYKDEITGYRQSPFGESMYNVQYDHLSGKIFHGKYANALAGWLLTISTLFMSIFGGFVFGFVLPYHIDIPIPFWYPILGLFILSLISLPLSLIKRQVVGLYNKNGNIEYSLYVNHRDEHAVEKIIAYVQSKTPTENKQLLLEE